MGLGLDVEAGLDDVDEVAEGLALGLGGSEADGLTFTASGTDWLLGDDDSTAVSSGSEPVRASRVTSGADPGDGSADADASSVAVGDGDGSAEDAAVVGEAVGVIVGEAAGVTVGDADAVTDGLGEASTLDGTHNGGISAGICHALSSAGCEVASSLASWGSSEVTTCGDSAAQTAGEAAITTTMATNTERPARTRARVDRSLVAMGANPCFFSRGSGMINRRSIQGKARTYLSRAKGRSEPSSSGKTNPRVVVEGLEIS